MPGAKKTGAGAVCREPYQRSRVARESWGPRPMPNPEYFRRQADICLRLSLIASDDEVSNRLMAMARSYMAKGDALEQDAPAEGQLMTDRNGSTGRGVDLDGAGLAPQRPGGQRRRRLLVVPT